MNQKIEVIIHYELGDFWRVNFDYYFSFRTFLIFATQFAFFGVFISLFLLRERLIFSEIGAVILAAILFTAINGITMAYWSAKNAMKNHNKSCEYHFSDEKVEMITDEFQSDVKWDHFYKISESGKYFSLFSRSHDEHMLPIRCFQSNSEVERFCGMMRSKADLLEVTLPNRER